MENFVYDIGTKVYFGQGQLAQLKTILTPLASRVLLVYGGGSIKRNGIYDAVVGQLKEMNLPYVELSGVEANPRIQTIRKGIQIAREFKADLVLPIGGGSVIDCSKLIAAGYFYEDDPWDLVKNPNLITKALPIVTIVTIAATGSEMDHIAVISNPETDEKIGTRHPVLRPKASIMDPTYTFTVSKVQTASGVADILSHAMESYFANEEGYFQDRMAEALMKTVIHFGPIAVNEPTNYEARANIMWASSWAINDFLKLGKMVAWSVHPIEHQLSAVYDITHGIGLAILTPHWMKKVLSDKTVDKMATWAQNVFDVPCQDDKFAMALAGIDKLYAFYGTIGITLTLKDLDIDETHFEEMAKKAAPQCAAGYVPLSVEDIVEIYKASL